jgi:hypothetical protein
LLHAAETGVLQKTIKAMLILVLAALLPQSPAGIKKAAMPSSLTIIPAKIKSSYGLLSHAGQ